MILTANDLKGMRISNNEDTILLLKALGRMQKAARILVKLHERFVSTDEAVENLRQALRDTGWEVTDGKD